MVLPGRAAAQSPSVVAMAGVARTLRRCEIQPDLGEKSSASP